MLFLYSLHSVKRCVIQRHEESNFSSNIWRGEFVIAYIYSLAMGQRHVLSANLCPRRIRHHHSDPGIWTSDLSRHAPRVLRARLFVPLSHRVATFYTFMYLMTLTVPTTRSIYYPNIGFFLQMITPRDHSSLGHNNSRLQMQRIMVMKMIAQARISSPVMTHPTIWSGLQLKAFAIWYVAVNSAVLGKTKEKKVI